MAKKWRVDRAAMFQWTLEELRKKAKQVFETANRRMRNIKLSMQYKGALSPAYDRVMNTGGLFSKRDKNKRGLIRELNRAYAFLNSDDGSTVNSAVAYGKAVREMTPNVTDGELKVIWSLYRELENKYPAYISSQKNRGGYISSDQVYQLIKERVLSARNSVYGGLGGDLLSQDNKIIGASVEDRKSAIRELSDKLSKEVEDWANGNMNSDGTMNQSSRTFKMKVDDIVPDMKNGGTLSMTLNSGTKYVKNPTGDGVIRPGKNV